MSKSFIVASLVAGITISLASTAQSADKIELSFTADSGPLLYSPPHDPTPSQFSSLLDDSPVGPGELTADPVEDFAVHWMSDYLEQSLQNRAVGYAYVINRNGQPAAWQSSGYARTPEDGGVHMSIHTRSALASVTKQITSVATVRILHQAGLSIETKIADFLPADWKLGSGVEEIRFRHLLNHTTGWGQLWDSLNAKQQEPWNNDWDGLEYVTGLPAMPGAASSYKNANTALLRILIPQIWIQMGGAPVSSIDAGSHSMIYLAYLQTQLFDPIGIYNVVCWLQPNQEEALAYSYDHADEPGVAHISDLGSDCGGHSGLRLSAVELAAYLAHLRHSSELLQLSELQLVNNYSLGWDVAHDGRYAKGGYWFSTYTVDTHFGEGNGVFYELPLQMATEYSYRKASRACVAFLPYNVEVSLLINSETAQNGDDFSTCGSVLEAFDDALSDMQDGRGVPAFESAGDLTVEFDEPELLQCNARCQNRQARRIFRAECRRDGGYAIGWTCIHPEGGN